MEVDKTEVERRLLHGKAGLRNVYRSTDKPGEKSKRILPAAGVSYVLAHLTAGDDVVMGQLPRLIISASLVSQRP